MSLLFKNVKSLVIDIDEFINTVEHGVLVFKEGVLNYLNDEGPSFKEKIKEIERLESVADKLQRKIDDEFYIHSILPQHISDIETMIDKMDEIIDTAKDNLYQFDVEIPYFPEEIVQDYIRLTNTSVESALAVFPAVRTFFREPIKVKDQLSKVYFYEREADKIARSLKTKLFHKLDDIGLAKKIHLRYFALHIESISDKAENLADMLTINAMKITL